MSDVTLESLAEAIDELKARLAETEFAYEFAMRFDDAGERLRAVEWARAYNSDRGANYDYAAAGKHAHELLVTASAELRKLRPLEAFPLLAFRTGMSAYQASGIANCAHLGYERWRDHEK